MTPINATTDNKRTITIANPKRQNKKERDYDSGNEAKVKYELFAHSKFSENLLLVFLLL